MLIDARWVVAIVLTACGTGGADSPTDGGQEAADFCWNYYAKVTVGRDASATPAPTGGGYCCPLNGFACGGGSVGGWVATPHECCSHLASPDIPLMGFVDSHGCAGLARDNAGCCQQCSGSDAGGKDSATDSATDAPKSD